MDDRGCPPATPRCLRNACVECLSPADCPEHYSCVGSRCTPPPLPGAPLSVHLIEARPRRIEVGWVYNGVVAATNWLLTATAADGSAYGPAEFPGAARAGAIDRLRPNTEYRVCVRGTSLIGSPGPEACIAAMTPLGAVPLSEAIFDRGGGRALGLGNVRALDAASRGAVSGRLQRGGLPPEVRRYLQEVLSGRGETARAPSTLSPDLRRILDRSFRRRR